MVCYLHLANWIRTKSKLNDKELSNIYTFLMHPTQFIEESQDQQIKAREWIPHLKNIKILDPACGAASFWWK